MRRILFAVLAVLALPGAAGAAAPDNNVEWNGVSHVGWQDRRPLCPVGGESFQVRFQTYVNDITSARVHADDGTVTWVTAAKVGTRSVYDVWAAAIPASTPGGTVRYWIELTDGSDTDYYSVGGTSDGTPVDGGFVVDFATLEHAPIGATRTSGGGAVFKVWAPTRVSTYARGDFNGWSLANPLTKVGEHFIGLVPVVGAGQEYKFFFNNSVYNTDARGRAMNPADNNNSIVADPFAYGWNDAGFVTPSIERMIVYQLQIGTFAGRNDPLGSTPFPSRYVDVAARAGQLAQLGINAVMFNPFTEFPGDLSAGYNPKSLWAPEWKYGTPDECKAMVDSLHRHGIAALLDIVWNHFTFNENFMWNYDGSQIYFDSPAVDTPWGSQADFDQSAVRDYYVDSALYWLEEFHLDGFRMDATSYMNLPAQAAAGWALMQRLNDTVDNRWVDKVVIAEQLPDDPGITTPTSAGGAGFDCQYRDVFVDDLRQAIFDAAFGDPSMAAVRTAILGGGTYLSGNRVLNYLELHDEAWPSSGGQRIVRVIDTSAPYDDLYAKGRVKLGQGLVLTAPGVPAMLMGSEWLEDTNFGADASSRIDWSKRTTYAPIYRYFQDLIALRRDQPELYASASVHVFHVNEGGNVIAFRRYDAQNNASVVIANFSNTNYASYRIGLPLAGPWHERIDSQSSVYDGNGLDNPGTLATDPIPADGFVQSVAINVPQMGLLMLGPGNPTVGVDDVPRPPATRLRIDRVTPSPARGSATLTLSLPRAVAVKLAIYDARGARVATLLDGPRGAGTWSVRWDGRDARGGPAPAGIYFARIDAGSEFATSRFALIR